MKRKLIPIFISVILIAIVIVVSYATGLIQKYSYSFEKADLYEYFGLATEDEVALMLDNEYQETKALVSNGVYYIDLDMVTSLFNKNFYFDKNEKLLLYSLPEETLRADAASGVFLEKNDKVYVSVDYVKKYTNLEYTAFQNPNHMEIKYQWGTIECADVTKDTEVRILGGVKSEVLTSAKQGDLVQIIEPMEEWSKVKTADGFLGYIENKRLEYYREEAETPVTEVAQMSFNGNTRDHKIILGWHQVMNTAANESLSDTVANTTGMNVISPTWFSLSDNEGNFTSIASADYVQKAHEMGLEVWGLVDNFSTEISSFEILSYTSKRQNLINQLVASATELGMDGINIDFENLSGETGVHFAQFIRELSIPCRANGLVLSVDNYVPKDYTNHYYRDVQGQYADYVIIMGYDEHFAGSAESGSVASVDFVREGIENTLVDVPANKVINGIPFYTRVWTETGAEVTSEALGMVAAESFLAENGVTAAWDELTCQNYAQFEKGGSVIKVWLEDAASVDVKMQLIQKNNLAGVACWKLGFENSSIWETITKYVN